MRTARQVSVCFTKRNRLFLSSNIRVYINVYKLISKQQQFIEFFEVVSSSYVRSSTFGISCIIYLFQWRKPQTTTFGYNIDHDSLATHSHSYFEFSHHFHLLVDKSWFFLSLFLATHFESLYILSSVAVFSSAHVLLLSFMNHPFTVSRLRHLHGETFRSHSHTHSLVILWS